MSISLIITWLRLSRLNTLLIGCVISYILTKKIAGALIVVTILLNGCCNTKLYTYFFSKQLRSKLLVLQASKNIDLNVRL